MRHCSPRWPRFALPLGVGTDYNGSLPHSQLGWKTPSEFAFTFHPRRDLAPRYAKGSAPAPVAHIARQGNPNARCQLTIG